MSAEHLAWVHGTAVLVCAPDGIPVDTDGVTIELLGEAIGQHAEAVVVPVERLTDDFFTPATAVADRITDRFTTYRIQLAVVGDLSGRIADTAPVRTWLAASERSDRLWMCPSFAEFTQRLRAGRVTLAM
jgi:hypothetical protein